MTQRSSSRVSRLLFAVALAFIIYMPLHVFIAQSASLLTGGIEVWKATKDIVLVILVPLLLYLSYKRGLFVDKTFRWLMIIGAGYTILHLLFVVFDQDDDTYSAIVASVYNTRLLGYLLLGYVVGSAKNGQKYLQYLLTAAVLIASLVAAFGVAQYFLPPDLLTNAGYSLERGVKPLFFIDDKPELPRVMSTLKDPNSLGAYLILPILLCAMALVNKGMHKKLFVREFRQGTLAGMLLLMSGALFFSFSRGAVIGLVLAAVTLLYIVTGQRLTRFVKKYYVYLIALFFIMSFSLYQLRDSALVQDYVFHAATTTDEADPNEKRILLFQDAVDDIVKQPRGYGPGSAGLVAITNPQGGVLTENYFLQIAYEVGWTGKALFVFILAFIAYRLSRIARSSPAGAALLASLVAYLFYSMLIHLWSNEAVALQWWLLTGATLGVTTLWNSKNLK